MKQRIITSLWAAGCVVALAGGLIALGQLRRSAYEPNVVPAFVSRFETITVGEQECLAIECGAWLDLPYHRLAIAEVVAGDREIAIVGVQAVGLRGAHRRVARVLSPRVMLIAADEVAPGRTTLVTYDMDQRIVLGEIDRDRDHIVLHPFVADGAR